MLKKNRHILFLIRKVLKITPLSSFRHPHHKKTDTLVKQKLSLRQFGLCVSGRLMICFFCLLGFQGFAQPINESFEKGKVYYKLKDNIGSSQKLNRSGTGHENIDDYVFLSEIAKTHSLNALRRPFFKTTSDELQRTFELTFSEDENAEQIISELEKSGMVEYAEKVPSIFIDYTPNDPNVSTYQWYLTKINAFGAWDYCKGNKDIIIAIVDNGTDITATDLRNNLWINTGEIPGNGIDDDSNGHIDDINGWDFGDNDNNVNPPSSTNTSWWHGTNVAGLAAARSDNGWGLASIGFNLSVMAIKASENTGAPGDMLSQAAYEGVTYAADNGARIINMSWGGYTYSKTNENVIAYAVSKGVVLVSSAGNDNSTSLRYPASYAGVIKVAATDENDKKSSFSNYGNSVDISAPGSNIWNIAPNEKLVRMSGTSQAAPIVSGLAGLMLSLNPNLTPAQIESCIKSSATKIDALNPSYAGKLGAGRINASVALQCVATVTGTNNMQYGFSELTVYPNPFSTGFTLKMPSDVILSNTILKIYDVCGKEVKVALINDSETKINRDELQNGLYFYSVINNNGVIGKGKLIIQ